MFMVGSFAEGLSGGLQKGFKFGTDVQEAIYERERTDEHRKRQAQAEAKAKDTTLPALKGIAAEAPSAYTESDPTGMGTSGGEPFDPNHLAATTPVKTENGFVPKPATRSPQPALPTAAPVAALPTTMPTPSVNETMETPDQYVQPQQFLPGRGNSPMPAVVVPPATPTPRQQVQDWWKRSFAAPPVAPGTMVGGALPGRGNSGYRPPPSPVFTAPVFTAPIPPPSSPTPSVQIDPRTGQPVQQAIPLTGAPY